MDPKDRFLVCEIDGDCMERAEFRVKPVRRNLPDGLWDHWLCGKHAGERLRLVKGMGFLASVEFMDQMELPFA